MFKHKPLEARKALVKAIIARMAKAYGVKKKELPDLINCQKSVINNWGYYGRVPYDHLDQCHEKTGVSMDWLLYGDTLQFEMTPQMQAELNILIAQLFIDGHDYGMITQTYAGAIEQLKNKFKNDISTWLGARKTTDKDAFLDSIER
jgi:hypothetical protein